MKRAIAITLFGIITQVVSAQLVVGSNGNVGIKVSDEPIRSNLSVNSNGVPEICSYIVSTSDTIDIGLKVIKDGSVNTVNDYNTGINSTIRASQNSDRRTYGVYSHAYKYNSQDTNSGRSYGVLGIAGNSSPGWNYGLLGMLIGNNNGAGVYGTSISWDSGMDTQGRYAGYFHGKVKATDAMYATAFNTFSDYRLKENIESIDNHFVDEIMKLNVVSYNLKQRTVNSGDTATTPHYYYTDSALLSKTHYGLVAQELLEILPDLVYEGEDGYLSVNYIEIIPLLIKTIQELKMKVDNLTSNTSKIDIRNEGTTNVTDIISSVHLYQNNPNPFTENTFVKCYIPNLIKDAVLYIYDLNGRQIDSIIVYERGSVSLTIEGSSLEAGMYLYSLITDGVLIDTKRMILTK